MLGSALYPGTWLVNPVDQTDFREAAMAIGEAPNLAHGTAFLVIVGLLLETYGLLSVYALVTQQSGVNGYLLRFGLIIGLLELIALIIATAMRHLVAYLMQQSAAVEYGSEVHESLVGAAITLQIDVTGVTMAFIALFPFSTTLVGIGLVHRMSTMNIYKIASYGLILVGAAGLINYVLLIFGTASEPWAYIKIISVLGFVGSISLFILAIGMYRQCEGLAEQESDA